MAASRMGETTAEYDYELMVCVFLVTSPVEIHRREISAARNKNGGRDYTMTVGFFVGGAIWKIVFSGVLELTMALSPFL